MDALELLSWQTLAAAGLVLAGIPVLTAGLWREWDGLRRPLRDPAKVPMWVRGFPLSMIALALAGSGAGWLLDRPGS